MGNIINLEGVTIKEFQMTLRGFATSGIVMELVSSFTNEATEGAQINRYLSEFGEHDLFFVYGNLESNTFEGRIEITYGDNLYAAQVEISRPLPVFADGCVPMSDMIENFGEVATGQTITALVASYNARCDVLSAFVDVEKKEEFASPAEVAVTAISDELWPLLFGFWSTDCTGTSHLDGRHSQFIWCFFAGFYSLSETAEMIRKDLDWSDSLLVNRHIQASILDCIRHGHTYCEYEWNIATEDTRYRKLIEWARSFDHLVKLY